MSLTHFPTTELRTRKSFFWVATTFLTFSALFDTVKVWAQVNRKCLWLVDRQGLCSPEKDCCCLWLTFRQPVWKSSSEWRELHKDLWRWLPHGLSKRQSQLTTVLLSPSASTRMINQPQTSTIFSTLQHVRLAQLFASFVSKDNRFELETTSMGVVTFRLKVIGQ